MTDQVVANRYAQALFQVAKEKDIVEQVLNEWQIVKEVVETTPSFIQFLNHPKVTIEQKREFIQTSFGQSLSETSMHTFFLLIDRTRIESLTSMINKFQELAYEDKGMAEAFVYSAQPLTEQEKQQISTVFSKRIGKTQLIVNNIVNSELLGGIKVRIGDHIFDGSVKAQLDRMGRQLITGTH